MGQFVVLLCWDLHVLVSWAISEVIEGSFRRSPLDEVGFGANPCMTHAPDPTHAPLQVGW